MNHWFGTGYIFAKTLGLIQTRSRLRIMFAATMAVGYSILNPKSFGDFIASTLLVVVFDWLAFILLMILCIDGERVAQFIMPKIFIDPDESNPLHQVTYFVLSVMGLPISLVLVLINGWRRF